MSDITETKQEVISEESGGISRNYEITTAASILVNTTKVTTTVCACGKCELLTVFAGLAGSERQIFQPTGLGYHKKICKTQTASSVNHQ